MIGMGSARGAFVQAVLFLSLPAVATSFGAEVPDSWETRMSSDKPIAWWKLNEPVGSKVAECETNAGLNGTYSATGISFDQPGVVGNGVFFDGFGTGRVQVTNHPLLNPGQITIEAIVVWSGPIASAPDLQQRILEKSTESSGKNPLYSLMIRGKDSKVGFEINTTSGFRALLSSSTVLPDTPLHIVATYDGSWLTLYINGVLDGVTPWTGALRTTTSQNLAIGNQIGRERPFFGTLDDVVLYDYALTPLQIQSHAAKAIPSGVEASNEMGSSGGGCSAGGSKPTTCMLLPSLLLLSVLLRPRGRIEAWRRCAMPARNGLRRGRRFLSPRSAPDSLLAKA